MTASSAMHEPEKLWPPPRTDTSRLLAARKSQGGGHVGSRRGPGNDPRAAIDVAVPHAFGPHRVVVGVLLGHQPAGETGTERLEIACPQFGHDTPLTPPPPAAPSLSPQSPRIPDDRGARTSSGHAVATDRDTAGPPASPTGS